MSLPIQHLQEDLPFKLLKAPSNSNLGGVVFAAQAASDGDLEELKAIVKNYKLNINAGDYDKRTALHLACAEGRLEIVEWLLSQPSIDISRRDRWGMTPLSYATKNKHTQIADLLKKELASQVQVTTWQSENDIAYLELFNDPISDVDTIASSISGIQEFNERRKYYSTFYDTMKKKGVKVSSIQDLTLMFSGTPEFEELLIQQLHCVSLDNEDPITAAEILAFKKSVIAGMPLEQAAFAATNKITFKLRRSSSGNLVTVSYEVEPQLDLFENRMQICTPKGVVLVGTEETMFKTNLLKFIFQKIGLKVLLQVPDPLKISGGDYIAAGEDLCFMGTGLLTNEAAVMYMMSKDVFGHRRVAMVRDLFDRSERRRNLDAIFKIIDKNTVLMLECVMGRLNLRRRIVDEYVRVAPKKYQRVRSGVEFAEYVQEQGFHIIEVSEHLYNKGFSVINLGQGSLLVGDQRIADVIKKSPYFHGTVAVVSEMADVNYDFLANTALGFRKPTQNAVPDYPPMNASLPLPRVWNTSTDPKPKQATDAVLMVAPVGFQSNVETAADNYFMKKVQESVSETERKALLEFSAFTRALTTAGVKILLFSSERFHKTPDAVFPNNWFTTHAAGELGESTVVFYPLKTTSRRNERRQNIISELQAVYQREISFVQWENSDFPHFLEGTGALVLDRVRKVAYATLSKRCYSKIANTWAHRTGYQLCLFHGTDIQGRPIYHTNVLMAVGTTLAIVCLECVEDPTERKKLTDTLSVSHEIMEITRDQMNDFCGNVLEVVGNNKRYMCMSTRAYTHFTDAQKRKILEHVDDIIHSEVTTIETIGGGGIRCMMGELF